MKSRAKQPKSKPAVPTHRNWRCGCWVGVGACRAAGTATVELMTETGRRDGHLNFCGGRAAAARQSHKLEVAGASPAPATIPDRRGFALAVIPAAPGRWRQAPPAATSSRRTAGCCHRDRSFPGGALHTRSHRVRPFFLGLHLTTSLTLGRPDPALRDGRPIFSPRCFMAFTPQALPGASWGAGPS